MSKETIQIKALIQTELDTDGTLKKVSGIQQALKKMTLPDATRKQFEGLFENLNKDIERVNSQLSKGFSVKGSLKNFNQMTQSLEQSIEDIFNAWNKLDFGKISLDGAKDIREEIKKINKEISELSKKESTEIFSKFEESLKKLKGGKAKETGSIFKDLLESGDLKQANKILDEIIEKRKKYAETKSTSANIQTIQADLKVFEELKKLLEENSGGLTTFQNKMNSLESGKAEAVKRAMELLQKALSESGVSMEENIELAGKLGQELRGVGESANQAARDMDSIKDKIKYFFSLNNAISLVRQTLRQTFEQIKELDAAMTETAVVTDFSVGDMWDMLPQYTQQAKELGATTKGVYETMTLFYQQGLTTNEVVAIGTETLKMARIAGMDYEEATSKMTAALRGFNMELNELSAQKVNDVYSELAAITAADTDQIATAMTKTASIANSANMEFETTAAFLSQIIETTQESAETAGTAMKTVIARFTELKKDPSLIGEVDGEIIDANKIETALKSVGIPLRDVNGQFRDLDDVFLDIAKRWKGLDTNTQRYIATIAAGSRQQSRFIAMMSDYDRTIELVDRAYDSSGASAAQFAKTQESLEFKLNVLKNTWTEFLTGLMNQEAIKWAVEALTAILNLFNKLTTGSTGLMGSLLKVFMAFKVFKLGKVIFKSLFNSINTNFFKAGQDAKKNFEQGFAGAFKSKATFSFGKTFQKVFDKLHLTSKKTFSDMKFSVADYAKYASSHGPEAMERFEQSLFQLENQIKESLGDKDGLETGESYAKQIIKGFVDELNSGTNVNQAIQNLENKVNSKLDGSPEKEVFSVSNYDLNVDKLDAQAMTIEKLEKKTQAWSTALTSVGTVMTAFGNELEKNVGSLGTFGSGLSVLGDGASAAGMALGVLPGILKAITGSLNAGPLVAITAVVAAISVAISAFSKYKEKQEEARQAAIDHATKTAEETKANRELAKTLDETIEAYKKGEAVRKDVENAAEELIDKYDLESESVRLLTGDYEELTKKILEKRQAEEQENINAQTSGIEGVRGQLYGQLGQLNSLDFGWSASDELSIDNSFRDSIKSLLEDLALGEIISLESHGQLSLSKSISDFTDEELVNLSKFLNSYLSKFGAALEKQGKKITDSEIYVQLSEVISNTSSSFEDLEKAVESLADSMDERAILQYETEAGDINSIGDYQLEKTILQNAFKREGYNDKDASNKALEYFLSNQNIYATAEGYIVELNTKINGKAEEVELIKRYLEGEIPPEVFIRLIGQVDFQNINNTQDANNQANAVILQERLESADNFYNSQKEILDYLGENFTIEGIDPLVLQAFETQLKSLQGVLPGNVDLLEEWSWALQKGSLGITDFIGRLQNSLNLQATQLKQEAVQTIAYGINISSSKLEELNTILGGSEGVMADLSKVSQEQIDEALKTVGISKSYTEDELAFALSNYTKDKSYYDDKIEETKEQRKTEAFSLSGTENLIADRYGTAFVTHYKTLSNDKQAEFWRYDENSKTWTFDQTKAEEWARTEAIKFAASSGHRSAEGRDQAYIDNWTQVESQYGKYGAAAYQQGVGDRIAAAEERKKTDQANLNTAIDEYYSEIYDTYYYKFVDEAALSLGKQVRVDRGYSAYEIFPEGELKDEIVRETKQRVIEQYLGTRWGEKNDTKAKTNEERDNYNTAKSYLQKEEEILSGLNEISGTEIELSNSAIEYQNDILDEQEIKYEAIISANEDLHQAQELAVNDAKLMSQSIAGLQSQLNQIQNLTADGGWVDLETFQQLVQISPEIAAYAGDIENGMVDVSNAVDLVTEAYRGQIGEIKEDTRLTLEGELEKKRAMYNSLKTLQTYYGQQAGLVEGEVVTKEEASESAAELSENEAFARATVYGIAAEDISKTSNDSANSLIDDAEAIAKAYNEVNNALNAVNDSFANLENSDYTSSYTLDTSVFGGVSQSFEEATVQTAEYAKTIQDLLTSNGNLGLTELTKDKALEMYNSISSLLPFLESDIASLTQQLMSLDGNYNSDNKGSGTEKEIEKFDSLFNILQKITRVQELRNKLEKEYQKLLEEEMPNYEEIQKNLKEREGLLATENLLLTQKKALNEALLQSWIADNAEFSEYVWYDETLQKLQVDAAKINEADAETREKIDKAMKDGEKIVQDIADDEEEILDIELELETLRKAGINDLDKQLNKVEEINEAERDRNETESEIEILTNQIIWEEEKYLGLLEQENQELDNQVQLTEELAKAREQDLKNYLQKIKEQGYGDLMSYDFNTNMAILNKELFDTLPSEEQSVVQKVFDGLVDISEDFEDATDDAIEAIVDNTAALKGRREEAIASVEYVKELLLESRQREIDFYQEASDAIADSNSKILDSITESLELQRQDRENAKTEEELADMRNRLAYLQMDTSGANASEILSLQEQLKEKEEDYTDTLIDQKIDELERQNDLAAEQRERQISLMEWQLKNDEESGKISHDAYDILNSAFDDKGNLIEGSKLDVLIQQSDAIKGLSTVELNDKMTDIKEMLLTYFRYMTVDRLVGTKESGYSIGQDVSANFGLAEGTAKITGEGEVTFGNGYKISGITSGGWNDTNLSFADGIDYQELYANAKTAREVLRASVGLSNASGLTDSKAIAKKMPGWDADRDGKISAADARLILRASVGLENLNDRFYNEADLLILLAARDEGISSSKFDKMYKDLMKKDPVGESIDSKIQYFIDNLLGSKKFATGGLADFTGPAWLDGTKSRPELVLNQRDTQNFLQLKDILASFMSNNGFKNNSSENRGDNYYEIHLNVEKITSDYDVEQLANKVKSIIAEDANSRGVNSIYRRR